VVAEFFAVQIPFREQDRNRDRQLRSTAQTDSSDQLNAVAQSWDVVSGLQDEILTLYQVVTSHHRRRERAT
jgi:hypothetical protein